jgi:uncharacterized protein (DUF983 family)
VTPPTPSAPTLLGRALLLRCPVCGARRVFRRWVQMVEFCPGCAFAFERRPGQFIGAVGINTIAVFGLLLIALVVGFALTAPRIAVAPLLGVGLTIALAGPIVFYPWSKTLWTAIDLLMSPLEDGEALPPP